MSLTVSIIYMQTLMANEIATKLFLKLSPLNSNPVHGEVYSIQHYVIKFVSDLRQVGGFLH